MQRPSSRQCLPLYKPLHFSGNPRLLFAAGTDHGLHPRIIKAQGAVFRQEKTRSSVKKAGFRRVSTGKVVPIIGFELMTYRLQGGCSTN